MTYPSDDDGRNGLLELLVEVAEDALALPDMRCQPCLAAATFGGRHHCTGRASNRPSRPCPCPGEEDS